ncbi:hypothetical protein [uncultured Chitinophaga sp.]|uniref:hypothetical protein n=1 Tax=uncultured Chitinophaga sp. TaxID=339340 RepID=UPI00260EA10D|nr:hypothetical protein [uncultured Chitinophaga sp.]
MNIIGEADKYQPEAVEAARHVLGGREVHDSDYEQADSFKAALQKPATTEEESLSDFLESVMVETTDPKVIKQVNIFYITMTLLYVWQVLSLIQPLDAFLQCDDCTPFSTDFLKMIFPAVYIPVAMILLIQRKRRGWFLLTGLFIVNTIVYLIELYSFAYYWKMLSRAEYAVMAGVTVIMLVKIGLVLFLYRPAIAAYFNVRERARRNTLIISIAIGIVLSTFMALWLFVARHV